MITSFIIVRVARRKPTNTLLIVSFIELTNYRPLIPCISHNLTIFEGSTVRHILIKAKHPGWMIQSWAYQRTK